MQLAVIPPISILPWVFTSRYQLLLPQLLTYSKLYRLVYRQLCQDSNQYVILDNGAAEGVQLTDEELCDIAYEYLPDELVLPDIIGNGPETVRRVGKFLHEQGAHLSTAFFKLGAVAAGKDHDEAFVTILDILESYDSAISVIYIPRSLVTPDDKKARLRLARNIYSIVPEKEIHFLGASKYWVHELQHAAEMRIVRGLDTSAPFNYARYGAWVGSGAVIERPPAYFQLWPNIFPEDIVNTNLVTMREWTNGFD